MNAPTGSVTAWLGRLQAGDAPAASRLWDRYAGRMQALARRQIRGADRRAADEEDVALSAFDSFCRAAERRRFPRLGDRDDLWQVLVMLVHRKAVDLRQYHGRARRDVRREARPAFPADPGDGFLLDLVQGAEPDPRFAAEVADEGRRLLAALPDDQLRRIAVAKMEGYTNDEIAGLLGCARATVERRLARIRLLWAALPDA